MRWGLEEGTAAAAVIWLGFLLFLPRRTVILPIIGDDLHRLFRRTFVLATPSLGERTGSGNHDQHRYHHQLSHYPNHFQPFLLMPSSAHRREKELRRLRRQQERCHVNMAEESIRNRRKSHGFAFVRTVSCNYLECGALATLWPKRRQVGALQGVALTSDRDAHRADVAAGVESAQRNRVLACSK